jgi:hypothetical protein
MDCYRIENLEKGEVDYGKVKPSNTFPCSRYFFYPEDGGYTFLKRRFMIIPHGATS